MAQAITLNFTDARWARVVAAYQSTAGEGITVNAAYVKARLAGDITAIVEKAEVITHNATFSLTSFAVT